MTAVDKFVVIVPAAGIGSRMKASVAKQYLLINHHDRPAKTVIEHTLEGLLSHPKIEQVIVALHPQDSTFETLQIARNTSIKTVIGGAERVDSVLSGLRYHLEQADTAANSWVLVHDAARPCVTHREIDDLLHNVDTCDGAILGIPVADTLKKAKRKQSADTPTIEQTVDRTQLWQAQTPQFFPLRKLLSAIELAQTNKVGITDEASAMEHSHANIKLIEGLSTNIKITRPSDLALAAFYLNTDASSDASEYNNDNNSQGGTQCSV